MKYNNKDVSVWWKNSSARLWLNSMFLPMAFTEDEREQILSKIIDIDDPDSKRQLTMEEPDKLFCLSYSEVLFYLPNEEERTAEVTEYAKEMGALKDNKTNYGSWWLRTPGDLDLSWTRRVTNAGGLTTTKVNSDKFCIRPALWVKQK